MLRNTTTIEDEVVDDLVFASTFAVVPPHLLSLPTDGDAGDVATHSAAAKQVVTGDWDVSQAVMVSGVMFVVLSCLVDVDD